MNMRRICIAGVMAAVAFNAWGAGSAPASAGQTKIDVNGTWTAKMEGRGGGPATTMVFVFKQEKEKLSGTMATNGGAPVAIQDPKVYRTKITFAVESEMPAMPAMPGAPPNAQAGAPRKVTTKYEATVDGDTMTIESQMGGGMGGGMGGMPMGGGGGGGGMGGGGMGGPPGGGGGGMGGPPGGGGGGMGPPGGGMGGMGGMRGPGKIVATREK
jgi:hypothetical protein